MITAWNTMLKIAGALLLLHLLSGVVDAALFARFGIGADDTDGPTGRSGLALRHDAGTGCEYLASRWGGITPRLTADGRQICTGRRADAAP